MAFTIIAGGRQSLITDESVIHIDAATTVTPYFRNTVTSHPTEGGNNVSDHVYRQNTTIEVQGIITNYPIRDAVDAGPNRVREQYRRLVRLKENREFLSLRTELQVFEQCVITAMSFPRTAKVGDSLQFSITLEQVQVVEPEVVVTDAELLDRLLRPKKVGDKGAKNSETDDDSVFSKIQDSSTFRTFVDLGETLVQ